MLRVTAVTLFLLLCCSLAQAEITLKQNFFSGWQYSVDGEDFHRVGRSAEDLKGEMFGNDEALAHMDRYSHRKTVAMMLGVPGGALLGWPTGGYLAGGEWTNGYTNMVTIGGAMVVVSLIFDALASNALKQAVATYNDDSQSIGLRLDIRSVGSPGDRTPVVGLSLRF